MLVRTFKFAGASVLVASMSLLLQTGCACCDEPVVAAQPKPEPVACDLKPVSTNICYPMDVKPGECFAWVFVPPVTKTLTEQVMVREPSTRLEVVPAEYAWVEERVLVKEAATQLEATPVEFANRDVTLQTEPCHTDWHMGKHVKCATADKAPANNEFCYLQSPAAYKTISTQVVAREAGVREKTIPAEYTTVRKQIVKTPAQSHKVVIPAEYVSVEKTEVIKPGRMEWARVVCENDLGPAAILQLENSLILAGYGKDLKNGKLDQKDWTAIQQYQRDNGLPVGSLTYDTLTQLEVEY